MNILVVDDEALARNRVVRLLKQIGQSGNIHEAENGKEAVETVARLLPDVVLMDIQMPSMDGLEAAQHIAQLDTPPAIIFCTAYDEYALQAFHVQAVGYLLKPVRSEELKEAINKLTKINKVQAMKLNQGERRSHIGVKHHNALELIPLEHIQVFRADQKYVSVFHDNGEALIDDSLKQLEEEFSEEFVRVHRNSLVAVKHITKLHKKEDGSHWLDVSGLDQWVSVSRRHLPKVRKLLKTL